MLWAVQLESITVYQRRSPRSPAFGRCIHAQQSVKHCLYMHVKHCRCMYVQVETIYLGDRRIQIRTSVLEEKSTACNMLCCYADELKEGFQPWVQQVNVPSSLQSHVVATALSPLHTSRYAQSTVNSLLSTESAYALRDKVVATRYNPEKRNWIGHKLRKTTKM